MNFMFSGQEQYARTSEIIATLILDYKYEIEYDFSILVFWLHIITTHL